MGMGQVIAGCAKTRDGFAKAKDFVEEMQAQSLTQDAVIYGALINVCASHGLEEEAKETFQEMVEAGLTPNLFHYSALLNTFASKGKHVEAEHVVDQIRSAGLIPNLVLLSNYILNYSWLVDLRYIWQKSVDWLTIFLQYTK